MYMYMYVKKYYHMYMYDLTILTNQIDRFTRPAHIELIMPIAP